MTTKFKRYSLRAICLQGITVTVFMFFLLMISFIPVYAGKEEPITSHIVQVELREWSIRIEQTILKPGKVILKAVNRGSFMHEMVVIRTSLSLEAFKVSEGRVKEEAVGTVMGEIEGLAAGKSGEVTLDLPEGYYVLFCNNREKGHAQGHYQKGMRVSFKVEPS